MAKILWVSNSSAKGTLEWPGSSGEPIGYPHWVSFDAIPNEGHPPSQIC